MEVLKKIKKVSIKNRFSADIEFDEMMTTEDGQQYNSKMSKSGGQPIHPEFQQAIDEMRIHLITICEQVAGELDEEQLKKFNITGVTIGGSDEHEGCCVIGNRVLSHGQILNMVTPFTKYHPDNTTYVHAAELESLCATIAQEADAYLLGKFAPSPQLNLFEEAVEE